MRQKLNVPSKTDSQTVNIRRSLTMLKKANTVENKHKIKVQPSIQEEPKSKGKPPFKEQRLITDLVAELAIALNEKAHLESDNAALKVKCLELKHKLADHTRKSGDEMDRLMDDYKQFEEKLQLKDMCLARKDAEHLEQQKRFLTEVTELKTLYNKQKELFEKKVMELRNKIMTLEETAFEANTVNSKIKQLAETFQVKYLTYKAKVKYAVGVVSDLTKTLRKLQQKSEGLEKECQTDATNRKFVFSRYEDCSSVCSLHSQCAVHSENVVLRELFFKQHPSSHEFDDFFFGTTNFHQSGKVFT